MNLRNRVFSTAVMAAAMTAAAFGQGRITGIDVVNTATGIDVVITGKDIAKPKEIKLLNGQSYIAEFDANLDVKGFRRRVDVSGVRSIEVGWYSARPPKVRIHLKVDDGVSPTLISEEGKYILRVGAGAPADIAKVGNVIPVTTKASASDDFPSAIPGISGQATKPAPTAKTAPLNPADLKIVPTTPKPEEVEKPAPAANVGPLPKAKPAAEQKPVGEAKPPILPKAAPTPADTAKPAPRPAANERKVNLEFVGADVVQVLRALSAEAGVNIVTAPDVSPADKPSRLTVSLKGVTVSDALSYVTVMANLRFAKLNNTFFVTKSENFATTMREFFKGDTTRFDSRVVNVVSGEGNQIRSAILATYSQDGEGGFYDILDPQSGSQSQPSAPAGQPQAAGGAQGGKPAPNPNLPVWLGGDPLNTQGAAQQQAQTNRKVSYLMLVGDPRRLDGIESAIKELDSRIAGSFSVGRSDDTGAEAIPILSGQTVQIKEMLEKLLDMNPRKSDFSFSTSGLRELTEGDLTTSVLLMIGPKKDLAVLKQYAQSLDENLCKTAGISYSRNMEDLGRLYEVVDLKHIEPALAAFDLKNRIRGLYVTALPDPVTPSTGLGTKKDEKNDATKTPEGEEGKQTVKKDELEKVIGREPMKLVLRGTRQQIEEAKSYLALVDVAPKQVAFELRVLEMTREEALKLGLDWSLVTGGRLQNFRLAQGTTGASPSSAGNVSGDYRYRANDVVNFLATLDQSNNGRRLISRPNALVTDARPYSLFVGDTVRYVESIQSNQNGVTVQTNSLDVGVTMNLLARIGAEGNIALDLEQNFNILNGFTAVPGGGQLPQTSERRAKNFVNMKAGEIIAFGGLLQEQDRRRVAGIPILKDLPILGAFFSRTERTKERTEIVFLLAAVEVTESNRPDAASPRKAAVGTPDPIKDYLNGAKPPR